MDVATVIKLSGPFVRAGPSEKLPRRKGVKISTSKRAISPIRASKLHISTILVISTSCMETDFNSGLLWPQQPLNNDKTNGIKHRK